MKLSRLTIALYVGLIFVCGMILGGFVHSLYTVAHADSVKSGSPKPEDVRKETLATMKRRMNLSDEQVSKINSIYDETRVKFHEVRERYKPEMDVITKDQREKVHAILTPEQSAEYEKMIKERDEKDKQKGGRGPGPGM